MHELNQEAQSKVRVITVVADEGELVCESCGVVEPPLQRVRALVRSRWPERGRGLLVQRGGSVWTWFMRRPIDVAFLDSDLRVVDVVRDVAPRSVAAAHGAYAALELPRGTAKRAHLHPGMQLGWGVPAGRGAA